MSPGRTGPARLTPMFTKKVAVIYWDVGWCWRCRWRVEWHTKHEYWYRSQFGPFYLLYSRDLAPFLPAKRIGSAVVYLTHHGRALPDPDFWAE